jgi:hypothetical protein
MKSAAVLVLLCLACGCGGGNPGDKSGEKPVGDGAGNASGKSGARVGARRITAADSKSIEALIADLGDEEAREDAAEVLTERGAEAVEPLRKALGDPSSDVREAAADVLAEIGAPAKVALPDLIRLLAGDASEDVRTAAADALGALGAGAAEAVAALKAAMAESAPPYVRVRAASAYRRLAPADVGAVLPVLSAAARSSSATARGHAFSTMMEMGRSAVATLTELLGGSDAEAAVQAAVTLGAVGAEARAALRELQKAQNHEDAGVREAARKARLRIAAAVTALEKGPTIGPPPPAPTKTAPTPTGSGRAPRATINSAKGAAVTAVSLSADEKTVTVGAGDAMLRVHAVPGGKEESAAKGPSRSIFSPDGGTMLYAAAVGKAVLFDVASRKPRREMPVIGKTFVQEAFAFSADGERAAAGTSDGGLLVWSAADGSELASAKAGAARVVAVAFSPDGGAMASGLFHGEIVLWTFAAAADGTAKLTERLRVPGAVNGRMILAFSRDGKLLFSGGSDRTLRIRSVADGAEVFGSPRQPGAISALAVSPDGAVIATGCFNGEIKLWDAGGAEKAVLSAHKGPVFSLWFGRDGRTLASGGQDGTVRLWDAAEK